MTTTSLTLNTPFALMKASFELMLRINGTVLEGQRRWLEASARCADESIAITETDTDEVAHADGWPRLRELPMTFGGQWLEASTAYLQRAIETATTNHANFLAGLQSAAMVWRNECAQALGAGTTLAPLSTSLNAVFAPILPSQPTNEEHGASTAEATAASASRHTKPRVRRT